LVSDSHPQRDIARGANAEGSLSEVSAGTLTSAVTGTVDGAGVLSLDFKGTAPTYFTGKVDGAIKDEVLSIHFKTATAQACSYTLDLKKE
jgi:hypothetical protein